MSTNRAAEPGWTLVAMNDPTLRRGVWYRERVGPARDVRTVEICAGREGDDSYVRLEAGVHLSAHTLKRLVGCLDVGAWMVHENPPRDREQHIAELEEKLAVVTTELAEAKSLIDDMSSGAWERSERD